MLQAKKANGTQALMAAPPAGWMLSLGFTGFMRRQPRSCWVGHQQPCGLHTAHRQSSLPRHLHRNAFAGVSGRVWNTSVLSWETCCHSGSSFFFFLKEMVDWFNAIRAARFHYLQVAFPGASDEEVRRTRGCRGARDASVESAMAFLQSPSLSKGHRTSVYEYPPISDRFLFILLQLVPKLTRNFMKEGFMEKTGPKVCIIVLLRGTFCN